MQTIGERLEEARKKKGISIREAAEATKIRGDYLQKFESNQFDINLTDLYVRGFLRSYANFLKIPSDRLLNDYAALGRGEGRPRQPSREVYGRMDVSIASAEERNDAPEPEAAPPTAQPARTSPNVSRGAAAGNAGTGIDPALVFKAGKWIGVAALVLIVLWGAKAIFSSSPSDSAGARSNPTSLVQSATEPTINLVASDTVRVKVVAVADGRILLPDTTLTRGQVQPVPKPGPIYITYSVGKNLQVEVAGKRYPMPTEGYDRAQIK